MSIATIFSEALMEASDVSHARNALLDWILNRFSGRDRSALEACCLKLKFKLSSFKLSFKLQVDQFELNLQLATQLVNLNFKLQLPRTRISP